MLYSELWQDCYLQPSEYCTFLDSLAAEPAESWDLGLYTV